MNADVIHRLRAALVADRDRLAAEIEEYEQDGEESLSDISGENNYRDHMADQGSATFSRELELTLEEQARRTLASIEHALTRIEAGTYGTCARCGKPLGMARLEAMPTAELCISCKELEESA